MVKSRIGHLVKTNPKQSQFKPKQTQNKANLQNSSSLRKLFEIIRLWQKGGILPERKQSQFKANLPAFPAPPAAFTVRSGRKL